MPLLIQFKSFTKVYLQSKKSILDHTARCLNLCKCYTMLLQEEKNNYSRVVYGDWFIRFPTIPLRFQPLRPAPHLRERYLALIDDSYPPSPSNIATAAVTRLANGSEHDFVPPPPLCHCTPHTHEGCVCGALFTVQEVLLYCINTPHTNIRPGLVWKRATVLLGDVTKWPLNRLRAVSLSPPPTSCLVWRARRDCLLCQ